MTREGDGVTDLPVSYTHLRAHETPEHLVCRLLLEKKKMPVAGPLRTLRRAACVLLGGFGACLSVLLPAGVLLQLPFVRLPTSARLGDRGRVHCRGAGPVAG